MRITGITATSTVARMERHRRRARHAVPGYSRRCPAPSAAALRAASTRRHMQWRGNFVPLHSQSEGQAAPIGINGTPAWAKAVETAPAIVGLFE
jgi:hypothetical protein